MSAHFSVSSRLALAVLPLLASCSDAGPGAENSSDPPSALLSNEIPLEQTAISNPTTLPPLSATAYQVTITTTWNTGALGNADFDAHLRAIIKYPKYTLPLPLLPPQPASDALPNNSNPYAQEATSAGASSLLDRTPFESFTVTTAKKYASSSAPGSDTIIIKEKRGIFSHFVYNKTTIQDWTSTNLKVTVKIAAIDPVTNAVSNNATVYTSDPISSVNAAAVSAPNGRYWHTFSIDLDAQPPVIKSIPKLTNTPASSNDTFKNAWTDYHGFVRAFGDIKG